jgi:hypothetical protein
MTKRPAPVLPNIGDDELRRQLQPLAERVLPPAAAAVGPTPAPAPRVAKPKRQGMEFLLPEAVAAEMKVRAAQRQISATTLLLEILREAGYPVVDADFVDLRKVRRNAE